MLAILMVMFFSEAEVPDADPEAHTDAATDDRKTNDKENK